MYFRIFSKYLQLHFPTVFAHKFAWDPLLVVITATVSCFIAKILVSLHSPQQLLTPC